MYVYCTVPWNPSNADTNISVLISEASSFQGMQERYCGLRFREVSSSLERCPQLRGVLKFREVSSAQKCPRV